MLVSATGCSTFLGICRLIKIDPNYANYVGQGHNSYEAGRPCAGGFAKLKFRLVSTSGFNVQPYRKSSQSAIAIMPKLEVGWIKAAVRYSWPAIAGISWIDHGRRDCNCAMREPSLYTGQREAPLPIANTGAVVGHSMA